jgi:hypothetical protein
MTPTICGHEREVLRLVLQIWSVPGLRMGTVLTEAQQRAHDDANDPANLAELLAEALRPFGLFVLVFPYGARATVAQTLPDNAVIIYHSEINGGMVEVYPPNASRSRPHAMPKARAVLLRILELPQDATAEDAVKALTAS